MCQVSKQKLRQHKRQQSFQHFASKTKNDPLPPLRRDPHLAIFFFLNKKRKATERSTPKSKTETQRERERERERESRKTQDAKVYLIGLWP